MDHIVDAPWLAPVFLPARGSRIATRVSITDILMYLALVRQAHGASRGAAAPTSARKALQELADSLTELQIIVEPTDCFPRFGVCPGRRLAVF